MVKVLAIVPCGQVFGLQKVTLDFFKYLNPEKVRARFLVTHWSDGDFAARLTRLGIPFDTSYLGFLSKQLDSSNLKMTLECVFRLPWLFLDLLRLMRRHRFDVFYVSGYHLLIQIFPIVLLSRTPVVYHVHDLHPNTRFLRRLYWLLDKVITRYVTVSETARARLRLLGIDEEKIETIYNGVDLSLFDRSLMNPRAFRERNEWPESTRLVAFVGQMDESKGVEDFIEAAKRVCAAHQDSKMLLVGNRSGDYAQRLQREVASLGLEDRIIFSGFQENVAELFAAVDVVVVPSRCDEAFGLVAAEAMVAGKPVVVTKSGGLMEVVPDEQYGLIVAKRDVEGIAAAILTLINDQDTAQRMGRAGRLRVEQMFSIANQAHLLEACFMNVMGSQPEPVLSAGEASAYR